jgi:hypothetical protein
MNKLKVISGILAIFLLGAIVGTLITRMIYENRVEALVSGDSQVREEAMISRLSKNIDLDETQRSQIRVIIHEMREELRDIYKQVRPQSLAVREKHRDKIRKILRPEQIGKYEKIIAESKER